MIKVLFVCAGNICRSPMAEGVFQDLVRKAGLSDKIQTDSAGTGAWHVGEAPQPGTQRILREHNIHYTGRSRKVSHDDLQRFDYVVAMDRDNLAYLQRLPQQANTEVALFLSYANHAGTLSVKEVPDPYYNGKYDEVYRLVIKGCAALLDHIRKTHQL